MGWVSNWAIEPADKEKTSVKLHTYTRSRRHPRSKMAGGKDTSGFCVSLFFRMKPMNSHCSGTHTHKIIQWANHCPQCAIQAFSYFLANSFALLFVVNKRLGYNGRVAQQSVQNGDYCRSSIDRLDVVSSIGLASGLGRDLHRYLHEAKFPSIACVASSGCSLILGRFERRRQEFEPKDI